MFNISCHVHIITNKCIAKLVTLMVFSKMLKCKCNMFITLLISPLTMNIRIKFLKSLLIGGGGVVKKSKSFSIMQVFSKSNVFFVKAQT